MPICRPKSSLWSFWLSVCMSLSIYISLSLSLFFSPSLSITLSHTLYVPPSLLVSLSFSFSALSFSISFFLSLLLIAPLSLSSTSHSPYFSPSFSSSFSHSSLPPSFPLTLPLSLFFLSFLYLHKPSVPDQKGGIGGFWAGLEGGKGGWESWGGKKAFVYSIKSQKWLKQGKCSICSIPWAHVQSKSA